MNKYITLAGAFFVIHTGIVLMIESVPSLWKFSIWQMGHFLAFIGAVCLLIGGIKGNK